MNAKDSPVNGVLPASLRFLRPAEGHWGDRQGDSGHVAITVSVAFSGLEPVVEVEQLIKWSAQLHVVDRVAEVADQLLEVEAVDSSKELGRAQPAPG